MATTLSKHHQKVKRLRRLVGRRSARRAEGVFVLEGAKVVHEALDAGARIEGLYVVAGTDDLVVDRARDAGIRVFELAPEVLAHVADTVTPQPVMAVSAEVDVSLDDVRDARIVLVCVDVRDPGNAGTVLRSAEASGVGAVLFCDGSVDLYNPKTVRASAGALFHVPVVVGGDPLEVLDRIGGWGFRRWASAARHGVDPSSVDLTAKTAIVLGNEASGVPDAVLERVDGVLTIPMEGRSESLNVGMAAAVLCYEAARQRRGS